MVNLISEMSSFNSSVEEGQVDSERDYLNYYLGFFWLLFKILEYSGLQGLGDLKGN